MDIFLEKEVADIKKVGDDKRYWFIRTYSGEAFQHYIDGNYVGVGLNNVPLNYIKGASDNPKAYDALYTFLINNTRYKKGEATKIANQLIEFTNEVKIGDTIIIPSKNSSELAFGTVESDIYIKKDPEVIKLKNNIEQLPEKRRKVKWDKVIDKDELQGDLRGLLASHQGVTNADDYGVVIESLLESLFIKDEHIYLVIQINQDEDINAFDFSRFLHGLTYFYQEFCKDAGLEINEDLSIKIKVQSRGKAILKALQIAGVAGLAGLLILCNDGELKVDLTKGQVEGKSKGLLKSWSDFLDRDQKRKQEMIIFNESLKNLKATDKPVKGEVLNDDVSNKSKTQGKQEDGGKNSD